MHNETQDPFQTYYRPTKREPTFTPPRIIHSRADLKVEEYEAWMASIPDSPIDKSVRLMTSATFAARDTRIAFGNRVAAHFATRLGANLEGDVDAEAKKKKVLDAIRAEYDKVTFGYADKVTDELKKKTKGGVRAPVDVTILNPDEDGAMLAARKFTPGDVFRSYAEYVTVHQFLVLYQFEIRQLAQLNPSITGIPIYDQFLSKVKGLGPQTSASLISSLNPYKAPHASSFHAYMGLDSGADGRGKGVFKEHMEERWYIKPKKNGDGEKEIARKMSRTYNAKSKARLLFIGLAGMMKANIDWTVVDEDTYASAPVHMRKREDVERLGPDKKPLRDENGKKVIDHDVPHVCLCDDEFIIAYMDMKHRLTHSEKIWNGGPKDKPPVMWKDCKPAHRNTAAIRYAAKLFLTVLWKVWRKLEGLPIDDSYAVTKLGHRSHHKVSAWAHVGDNILPGMTEADEDDPDDGDDFGDVDISTLGD